MAANRWVQTRMRVCSEAVNLSNASCQRGSWSESTTRGPVGTYTVSVPSGAYSTDK